MYSVSCQFGDLVFQVISDDAIAKQFRKEFGQVDTGLKPTISFYICRASSNVSSAIQKKFYQDLSKPERVANFKNDLASFVFDEDGFERILINLIDKPHVRAARLLPLWLQRLITKKYVTVDEVVYGHILYGCVLWWLFFHSNANGGNFLHSSAVNYAGLLISLSGHGGVGKTSLSGWLYKQRQAAFVSDDLLPITAHGQAKTSSIYVHIYPYNEMESFLWKDRWTMRRLHWLARKTFLGPKKVCARMPPINIYPRTISVERPIDLVVWLTPSSNATRLMPANLEKFISEHVEVLRHEMRWSFKLAEAMPNLAWIKNNFPQGFASSVEKNLSNSLELAHIWNFQVSRNTPIATNGEMLADAILEFQKK